jgi:hypothetical protein
LERDDDVGEPGEQDYEEPVGISAQPDQVGPPSIAEE